ncbi:MAG: phosphonate ABC transporter, permease protein PhnE, partial [Gammaproteobacteria bacterium]
MATIDYHWQRFSFGKKLARFSVYLFFITGFLFSIRSVEVIPEFLYDAPEQIMDLLSRMWPIDYAFYPLTVHEAIIETLNIATLGTLVTLIFAIPLALM